MEWEQPSFLEIRMDAELTYVNDLERDEAAGRDAAQSPTAPAEAAPAA